jgi:hypothetical protein
MLGRLVAANFHGKYCSRRTRTWGTRPASTTRPRIVVPSLHLQDQACTVRRGSSQQLST